MNDTLLDLALSSEDLITITQDVWSSFLGFELVAVPVDAAALPGSVVAAVVRISGAWEGSVRLDCPQSHAAAAAAVMFSGAVGGDDTLDALGELANVVAGNVKSLLPAPSVLSTPSVRNAASGMQTDVAEAAPEELVRLVAFVTAPGPLHVSIWKAVTS